MKTSHLALSVPSPGGGPKGPCAFPKPRQITLRTAWPSLPQGSDGTAVSQHNSLIMRTLRSSCKGSQPGSAQRGSRGCEPGRRRLWGCCATSAVYLQQLYDTFTVPL